MSGTKNLGQVAGLFIGTSAPSNTTLIWFDSTPAIQCHKVYNQALDQWVVLDNSVISPITYSEIVTLSTGNGLTIGQWFKITDRNGVLALAITTTKIQYTDALANIVIDDLGHNKSYIVSSSNLLIDDLSGVWDSVNNKLVFSFDEVIPAMNDNYYIFGKGKINNVWKFVKFKITKLLSTESGNAISWINGFYLNFTEKLRTYYNNPGGIVSKDSYDADQTNVQNQINNAANNIQNVAQQAQQNIDAAVTDAKIYSKQLPVAPVQQTAVDIVKNDTLQTIILKINNFIQRFKYATGIWISNNYSEIPTVGSNGQIQIVNNNDSVETAIGKLAATVRRLRTLQGNGTDSVVLSSEYSESEHPVVPGTTNLTDFLEQLALKVTRNLHPIHAVISYYDIPSYDNINRDRGGYGWFPCGYFFSGTFTEVNAEKSKWISAYSGKASIIFETYYYSAELYYLKILNVTPSGSGNKEVVPDLTNRMIRGYEAMNNASSYIGRTGGSDNVSIGAEHLPSHTHTVTCSEEGEHNHSGHTNNNAADGSHYHILKTNAGSDNKWGSFSRQGENESTDTQQTGTNGAHIHGIGKDGKHTHTITVTGGATSHQMLNVTNPMMIMSFIIRLM